MKTKIITAYAEGPTPGVLEKKGEIKVDLDLVKNGTMARLQDPIDGKSWAIFCEATPGHLWAYLTHDPDKARRYGWSEELA